MIDRETGLIMAEQVIVDFAKSLNCKTYEDVEQAMDILVQKSVRAVEKHRGGPNAQILCQKVYADLINDPQVPVPENR
jgi:hypothetical protein